MPVLSVVLRSVLHLVLASTLWEDYHKELKPTEDGLDCTIEDKSDLYTLYLFTQISVSLNAAIFTIFICLPNPPHEFSSCLHFLPSSIGASPMF